MAEMRTLELPAELYERLEQLAKESGLSVSTYLDFVIQKPLSLAEKLKAEGRSPLLAFVGLANDPTDPYLSQQIREVMEDAFSEIQPASKYSLLDLAGMIKLEEETDASERISEIMQQVFKDKLEQQDHDDSS